jgi:hypothetical protein
MAVGRQVMRAPEDASSRSNGQTSTTLFMYTYSSSALFFVTNKYHKLPFLAKKNHKLPFNYVISLVT